MRNELIILAIYHSQNSNLQLFPFVLHWWGSPIVTHSDSYSRKNFGQRIWCNNQVITTRFDLGKGSYTFVITLYIIVKQRQRLHVYDLESKIRFEELPCFFNKEIRLSVEAHDLSFPVRHTKKI